MNEGIKLKGHWSIEVREKGKLVKTYEIDNTLTRGYMFAVLNQLAGDSPQLLTITNLAVGTDSTTATTYDVALGAEIFRSNPTQRIVVDNYVRTTWVLTEQQANATLKEIGVFLSDGTMISRINIDIEKTEYQEMTFVRRDYVVIGGN